MEEGLKLADNSSILEAALHVSMHSPTLACVFRLNAVANYYLPFFIDFYLFH